MGLTNLYIKNDAVNHPTLSFKDRVVACALTKAREFGYDTVACASTGNLANSVAAHAAEGGFTAYVFIPSDLEQGKVLGTLIYGANVLSVKGNYDEVNRLCAEAGGKYGWAFVNINLRPFYGDGSKTFGYEIAEQLGWRAPDHVVVPCAGGSLISKIYKGLNELDKLGTDRRRRADEDVCRAGDRLLPDYDRDQDERRGVPATETQHDREVDRDRQPGRWLPVDGVVPHPRPRRMRPPTADRHRAERCPGSRPRPGRWSARRGSPGRRPASRGCSAWILVSPLRSYSISSQS